MDPNPTKFPVLSYVMSRFPSFKHPHSDFDVEKADTSVSSPCSVIVGQMPQISDPKLIASMKRAISDVAQARSVLKLIGERPTHEELDNAKAKLADIDAHLSRELEEIVVLPRPPEIPPQQWRIHLAEREKQCRESAEKEKRLFKSLIQIDEMHESYEKTLRDAEKRLVKIYADGTEDEEREKGEGDGDGDDEAEMNEEIEEILQEAYGKGVDRVDLSGQGLKFLPEAFGTIPGLVVLHINDNKLSAIPESISGLKNLEELNLSANVLVSLPESIGLLVKLKYLNVSGNKLTALPDSISHCRSLVELDASFNSLTYLPTNIGYELQSLQKLSIQLNKIRSFPSSVCEMKSLRYLDAHFNELHALPIAIGKLTNLEVLNLSSNFSDLTELPDTFADLISLRELDLSNNQIHALPDTFGRLYNLTKLNLEQNPIEMPPMEIVKKGVQAVKIFMTKRRDEMLEEEERKSKNEMQDQGENGWLTRSTSWLKNVSENVTEYIGTAVSSPRTPKSPRDAYLHQQL